MSWNGSCQRSGISLMLTHTHHLIEIVLYAVLFGVTRQSLFPNDDDACGKQGTSAGTGYFQTKYVHISCITPVHLISVQSVIKSNRPKNCSHEN